MFHVVKNSEKDLKQVTPPMRLESGPVGLDDVKKDGEGPSTDVELATGHDARELEKQWEPAPHPWTILGVLPMF